MKNCYLRIIGYYRDKNLHGINRWCVFKKMISLQIYMYIKVDITVDEGKGRLLKQ